MKKIILLVLTVMLVSAFLMASGPSIKLVRLVVINRSGNEVMIKLEGSEIGKQFYYLTIGEGTKSWPTVETFTILEDVYKRTTWYGEGKYSECVGTSSSGMLIADRNTKLTFTPCYAIPMRTIESYDPVTNKMVYTRVVNNGEPSMEKVVYYVTMNLQYVTGGDDTSSDNRINVYWKRGCGSDIIWWATSTKRVPTRGLCQWRYLYDSVHEW